jgi:hypothetical protein
MSEGPAAPAARQYLACDGPHSPMMVPFTFSYTQLKVGALWPMPGMEWNGPDLSVMLYDEKNINAWGRVNCMAPFTSAIHPLMGFCLRVYG